MLLFQRSYRLAYSFSSSHVQTIGSRVHRSCTLNSQMNYHLQDLKRIHTFHSAVTSNRTSRIMYNKATKSRSSNTLIKVIRRNHSTSSSHKNTEIASESITSSEAKAISSSRLDRLIHTIETNLLQPRTLPIPRWITPRSIQFTISEIFGHASFVLVAVSYATDDFLLLRIIAVAGSASMLAFTYFHPHGRILWLPFKWNMLFIFINGYRIVKALYYQNVGRFMSSNLKNIKNEYFESMDMVDYAHLIRYAEEEEFDEGDVVVLQVSIVVLVHSLLNQSVTPLITNENFNHRDEITIMFAWLLKDN
jgi:hypothetical protein